MPTPKGERSCYRATASLIADRRVTYLRPVEARV